LTHLSTNFTGMTRGMLKLTAVKTFHAFPRAKSNVDIKHDNDFRVGRSKEVYASIMICVLQSVMKLLIC